ncbi:hypothetical protein ACFIQF_16025 [Comamonas sp. J-3]|jgi:hypothetical protein|uniref:hypothetical protein n=1 Tax=Comamonas trifloxystrobinivorans TaxID=3350256 RepID=UPI0037279AA2
MDYTRPNHVPTDAEEARQTEQEQRGLIIFAVLVVAITLVAAIVFGSQITR